MTTDPIATIAIFFLAFLAFCAVMAAADYVLEWWDGVNETRAMRLKKVRAYHYVIQRELAEMSDERRDLVEALSAYGYHLEPAPDYIPEWMDRNAA